MKIKHDKYTDIIQYIIAIFLSMIIFTGYDMFSKTTTSFEQWVWASIFLFSVVGLLYLIFNINWNNLFIIIGVLLLSTAIGNKLPLYFLSVILFITGWFYSFLYDLGLRIKKGNIYWKKKKIFPKRR